MRRKLGAACMALGALCVLGALVLLLQCRREERQAARAVEVALPQVRQAIQVPSAYSPSAPEREAALEDMTETAIDGCAYIGILSIPSLELELPIRSGWSEEGLKQAPCRQFGTAEGGGLVIAGHNYKSHFGSLHKLRVGERVAFTSMDGTVYLYEVGTVSTIVPTAVEQVKHSPWDLLLYTCTLGGQKRVAVGCVKRS